MVSRDDYARSYSKLAAVLGRNKVWQELRRTARHEQKGEKRRRLRSERWRRRFKHEASMTQASSSTDHADRIMASLSSRSLKWCKWCRTLGVVGVSLTTSPFHGAATAFPFVIYNPSPGTDLVSRSLVLRRIRVKELELVNHSVFS